MDTVVDATQALFELITREFTAALPAESTAASHEWVGLSADARARLSTVSLSQAQRLARALDVLQDTSASAGGDAGGAASDALPAEVNGSLAAASEDLARRRAVNERLRALLGELLAAENVAANRC